MRLFNHLFVRLQATKSASQYNTSAREQTSAGVLLKLERSTANKAAHGLSLAIKLFGTDRFPLMSLNATQHPLSANDWVMIDVKSVVVHRCWASTRGLLPPWTCRTPILAIAREHVTTLNCSAHGFTLEPCLSTSSIEVLEFTCMS